MWLASRGLPTTGLDRELKARLPSTTCVSVGSGRPWLEAVPSVGSEPPPGPVPDEGRALSGDGTRRSCLARAGSVPPAGTGRPTPGSPRLSPAAAFWPDTGLRLIAEEQIRPRRRTRGSALSAWKCQGQQFRRTGRETGPPWGAGSVAVTGKACWRDRASAGARVGVECPARTRPSPVLVRHPRPEEHPRPRGAASRRAGPCWASEAQKARQGPGVRTQEVGAAGESGQRAGVPAAAPSARDSTARRRSDRRSGFLSHRVGSPSPPPPRLCGHCSQPLSRHHGDVRPGGYLRPLLVKKTVER
ncbi:hypothetical protein QTO34_003120 [Cnephaeus nilssonii]|uniref:Uncharacterized protein n=1 Tax=Cnephaeus nilssonii TaxID=3371016 RepID=A0AA40HQ17_CNENI|nr:hypothetical protein QTO34_003120 [Eptesicus nilssonii]